MASRTIPGEPMHPLPDPFSVPGSKETWERDTQALYTRAARLRAEAIELLPKLTQWVESARTTMTDAAHFEVESAVEITRGFNRNNLMGLEVLDAAAELGGLANLIATLMEVVPRSMSPLVSSRDGKTGWDLPALAENWDLALALSDRLRGSADFGSRYTAETYFQAVEILWTIHCQQVRPISLESMGYRVLEALLFDDDSEEFQIGPAQAEEMERLARAHQELVAECYSIESDHQCTPQCEERASTLAKAVGRLWLEPFADQPWSAVEPEMGFRGSARWLQ